MFTVRVYLETQNTAMLLLLITESEVGRFDHFK